MQVRSTALFRLVYLKSGIFVSMTTTKYDLFEQKQNARIIVSDLARPLFSYFTSPFVCNINTYKRK